MRLLRLLIVLAVTAAACSSAEPEPSTSSSPPTSAPAAPVESTASGPHPVIVDYSPTVSDVGALLYLLSNPDVDVVAITLPVTGEAGCELGFDVTLGILAMYGRDDIPVACDPDRPDHAEEWPAEFLTGIESLTFGLPEPTASADERPAYQLIADVAAASEQPPILYAVAPLTNVARALDQSPGLADQLDRIVIMGGAVDATGNVEGTDAEWNLWIDVPAAARVIGSDAPVTLVPLDATNYVPVPGFWQEDLEAAEQTEPIKYLTTMVRTFPAVTSGFFYLWDELAATVAAGEDRVSSGEMNVLVSEQAGRSYGATVRDPSGNSVIVATAVSDPDGFYAHFITTLAGSPVEHRVLVTYDEDSVPSTITSSSPPEEVLAYWLVNAYLGDVEAAGTVVAPDAPWIGFGASADVFVDGSEPYEAFDIELACTSGGESASCDVTWTDLWTEAIPELEHGGSQWQTEVVDGVIVAFTGLSFDGDTTAAFTSQTAWLQSEHPDRLAATCDDDPAARSCSELIVGTVGEWVASL